MARYLGSGRPGSPGWTHARTRKNLGWYLVFFHLATFSAVRYGTARHGTLGLHIWDLDLASRAWHAQSRNQGGPARAVDGHVEETVCVCMRVGRSTVEAAGCV